MKIAILGAHAGVHFISQRLLEEDIVEKVYHIGANLAIQPTGRYVPLDLTIPQTLSFLDNTELDFVFLTTINDLLNKRIQDKLIEKNIPSCSPTLENSLLEWSKIAGKDLLNKLKIPTSKSRNLKKSELFEQFFNIPRPWVLKFERDWRAGLQTVIITDDNINAEFENLQQFGQKRFMDSIGGNFTNQHFVVEDFIKGKREYSYHILSNGDSWEYVGSSRDYKKFQNGDVGTNTASMGCYSPVEINPLVHEYADKILNHLKSTGNPYKGILYLGVMEDINGNPYILEINTRPGDPEFQSILMTLDQTQSLAKILHQAATGNKIDTIKHNDQHGVCLRIVNSDYHNIVNILSTQDTNKLPVHYNPQLWPELPGMYISFNRERKLLNAVITTSATTRTMASDRIYKFLKNVEMHTFIFRTDIGYLE
jgi:phosphoribosylamine--glycine ligase